LSFVFSQTTWMPGQTQEKRVFPVDLLCMRTPVLLFILGGTAALFTYLALLSIPLYLEFTRVAPMTS
jgi:hypothetical protein